MRLRKKAQEQYVEYMASKKALLGSFIKELQIIPPHWPQVDVTKQGVFFAGQTFDALSAAAQILATAKTRIVLIDGYVEADTLKSFACYWYRSRDSHKVADPSKSEDTLSGFQSTARISSCENFFRLP